MQLTSSYLIELTCKVHYCDLLAVVLWQQLVQEEINLIFNDEMHDLG
jgi:hypothetical protein